jgi:hypothetical protein
MEVLWQKILFWKKQKPKTPEYQLQESPWEDSTWVKITSGNYVGVIFSYGRVKFATEMEIGKLEFTYNIIHPGNHDKEHLQNDAEYVNIMGDILTEIIIKYESTRTNDIEEPDLQ